MAADLHKEAKTFSIAEDKPGNKENIFGRFYGRVRTVDRAEKTAKNRTEWFFGLWRSEENYVLAKQQAGQDIFRRTDKTSFNGFRTKTTEYYPLNGKKSENRSYFGGLYGSGVEYGTDGRILGTSFSDPIGKIKISKMRDGRGTTHEQEDFGGWHYSRRETLTLPDGKAAKWRTVQRDVGAYSMKVVPDQDGKGETKTRGFGKLFGKNWLFSHSVHYNFETGRKTIEYSALFKTRRRTKERPMTGKELKKAEERIGIEKAVNNAWRQHATGVVGPHRDRTRPDPSADFAAGLQELSRTPASPYSRLSDWLQDLQAPIARGRDQQSPESNRAAGFGSRNPEDMIALGESATEKGIDSSLAKGTYLRSTSVQSIDANKKSIEIGNEPARTNSVSRSIMSGEYSDSGEKSPSAYSQSSASEYDKSSGLGSAIPSRNSDVASSTSYPGRPSSVAQSEDATSINAASDVEDRVRKAMAEYKMPHVTAGLASRIGASSSAASNVQRESAFMASGGLAHYGNSSTSGDVNERVRKAMMSFSMPPIREPKTRGPHGAYTPPDGYSVKRVQSSEKSFQRATLDAGNRPSSPSLDHRDDRNRSVAMRN